MIVLTLLLGLIFGSFISALTWRLHQQSRTHQSSKVNLSIVKGRSVCPNCHHILSPIELIPVLSWLLLRGRCRYCHKTISLQYPLTELITALAFVVSYIYWPRPLSAVSIFTLIVWLLILILFLALAIYDLKWYLLPNKLIYPLGFLSFVEFLVLVIHKHNHWLAFTGGIWGFLVIGGLFYVLFQVSDGNWIGGGDIRLGAIIGLIVGGPIMAVMVLFFASFIGVLITTPLLLIKKLKVHSHIPFGPLLILAAFIVELFGQHIFNLYRSLL